MTVIRADFAAMSAGHDGLLATWQRIEAQLAELDRLVLSTGDMQATALTAYQPLKMRWSLAAADRQLALKSLADLVAAARDHYRQVDAALAAQFTG